MEATLPISAAAKSAAKSARQVTPAATSVTLPLRFIGAGVLALFVGVGWLIAQPQLLTSYHYNADIVALTHLFVLGWICTVVMGATYQLVPVALETKLYSERLAKWQFVFHVVGFVGMVLMFRVWNMKQVGHFGTVMAISAALYVFNIARTLLQIRRWNVVAIGIASALTWFAITVLAGLSIAAAKCSYESTSGLATAGGVRGLVNGLRGVSTFMSRFDPIGAMHAHAHLGLVGMFTMLIVGVSYKLVPMFTLSEIQSPRRAIASILLLNVGLLGAAVCILLRSSWKFPFTLIVIAGLAIYGWETIAIVRARKRASVDWGVKSFLTAVAILVPISVVAAVLAWPKLPLTAFTAQLETLYGFLGIVGFVSFAIIGMLQKIIPFLVWFHSYSPHVGRSRVPAVADMYSVPLQVAGFWIGLAGLVLTGVGIMSQSPAVVRWGAILLATCLALFAVNVCKVLSHLVRRALTPLAIP